MAVQDDYQYQSWALPTVQPWGGSPQSNADIPQLEAASVSTASSIQANNPFTDGLGDAGGGGGTPTTPTCATNWDIGGINSSAISMPCSSPTSLYTADAVALASGGGTAELSAVNGWVRISNADGQLNIDMADVDPDSGIIELKELDTCHMGVPGKRQVVGGDAYAP